MMDKIVVSRYMGLVEYLKKLELIDETTKVVSFAHPEDVEGKHVFGIIPYWLAAKAGKFTEVQLRLPSDKRNKELTVGEVEQYSLDPKTYIVKEVPNG